MDLIPTHDPYVFIEEKRDGYTRYYRSSDGARWEITGYCDRRGDCLIGSVVEGVLIKDHEHLKQLAKELGRHRIDSEMDVPVTPEFTGCCPLKGRYLDGD